jgi:hypothetical protein
MRFEISPLLVLAISMGIPALVSGAPAPGFGSKHTNDLTAKGPGKEPWHDATHDPKDPFTIGTTRDPNADRSAQRALIDSQRPKDRGDSRSANNGNNGNQNGRGTTH